MRPYLDLTARGGVFVQKIVVKDGKAAGVQEADRVVLSDGAIRSPHLLMLSGIGPEDQLHNLAYPSIGGNGTTFDLQGRLVVCEGMTAASRE